MHSKNELPPFERVAEHGRRNDEEAEQLIAERVDLARIAEKLRIKTDIPLETVVHAFARLMIELKGKARDYDSIISDDTGARLVSLFVKGVFDKEARPNGKPTPLYFVASGGGTAGHGHLSRGHKDTMAAVEKFVAGRSSELGKTLFVTEVVGKEAATAKRMGEILKKNGNAYDVAALALDERFDEYDPEVRAHLIYGDEKSDAGSALYLATPYTGVMKSRVRPEPHPVRSPWRSGEALRIAREDIRMMVEELGPLAE